jgi:transcriptional regulator with PAS, ATPase and Fis domain
MHLLPSDSSTLDDERPWADPARGVLVVVGSLEGRPARARTLLLADELVIGRGPAELAPDRWAIDDDRVSRRQAVIRRAPDGYTLEDLGSRAGTWVGRALVRGARVRLKRGAAIVVGGELAVFRRMNDHERAAIDAEQERPLGPVPTASAAMATTLARLRVIAANDAPVLLAGETGTGKEVYARALHALRGGLGPFVAVNCAGLNRELFESHLFGYKRGSHSQAREDYPGVLATAEGGTLFLDEIGEIDWSMQAKLLRFLQDRTYLGLGWTRPRQANVRIVAATQRPEETLRLDILGRLGTAPFVLPPLRRRREDLPALCHHFLGRPCVEATGVTGLSRDAALAVCVHAWPMNVRALEATIVEAALLAADRGARRIAITDLPAEVASCVRPRSPHATPPRQRSRPRPSTSELEQLLREHRGDVPAVARQLDRHRELIWRWCKADGIDPERFRNLIPRSRRPGSPP